MRSAWYDALIPGGTVVALLLVSCWGGGDCGGIGGAGDMCPPPVSGYAQVNGRALRSDGSPIVGKQAYVGCGDVVGAYNDGTDPAGNFEVRLLYSVHDTLLYPYPPRAADGSFTISCQANLQLTSNNLLSVSPLLVRFAPTAAGVVPNVVELREGGP